MYSVVVHDNWYRQRGGPGLVAVQCPQLELEVTDGYPG